MEPEGWLPFPLHAATGLYTERVQSSPHIILLGYGLFYETVSSRDHRV
jgi:hypothetical protein